jgi:Fe2+ transport system protein FeoA
MPDTSSLDQNPSESIFLDKLKPGKCGYVVKVKAENDDVKKLMAMGVCEGRIIKLVHLGEPMILQVLGSRIGVSSRLGETVEVAPCEEDNCCEQGQCREE